MKVKRALISVSDKTGLGDFVKRLHGLGVEIISTGGTSREISSMGVPVREVASYTGFPEMLDGRVKTLHPKIHAGLLALRENPGHMRQLEEAGILPIDMVVVNLYPFEETTAREGVSFEDAIENIDIGGPAMLRSAAKNFNSVAAISSPSQYGPVLAELEANKCVLKGSTLKGLAAEVFLRVSRYDSLIAGYLAGNTAPETAEEEFPPVINIELEKVRDIRYGENPHQRASYYRNVSGRPLCVADAKQLQGKELSFNNIIDLGAAVDIV
ncbi:MAG: bifunctional phosphoribosylaminoimidazolecarboxamide formyltransferase/IMP cyclohydrolase, partial [Candidatus Omnitrophota bacterium]